MNKKNVVGESMRELSHNELNEFLYLILDYSHNHYTFKHFGV